MEDKSQRLRYDNLSAAYLDFSKKFLLAAQKYYQISTNVEIDAEDASALLNASAQCAILGNAGPLRTRVLAMLYKDERIHTISSFNILELTYAAAYHQAAVTD